MVRVGVGAKLEGVTLKETLEEVVLEAPDELEGARLPDVEALQLPPL